MQDLINFIDAWQSKRVIVVGDFMLDQLVYGNAERLSPDAPVPVLRIDREESLPGGASNVCVDLRALRCQVLCVGVVGDDGAAGELRDKLAEAGCDTTGLISDPERPTTRKRSYVGLAQHRHPQKMFRTDYESSAPLNAETQTAMLEAVAAELSNADVLCIEDYNKGVLAEGFCAELIAMAREANVPVLVDPAAIDNYTRYTGATAITPNRTEAQLATGLVAESPEQVQAVAEKLLAELKLEAVVLTLDRHGALLLRENEAPITVPTVARSVYDVTGAGDMVLAMLAAARANDAPWPDAVQLANVAAGLEVEKFGVVPIELSEVHLSLIQEHHHKLGKIRTADQLTAELAAYRTEGKKIAFTNGCFDILHAGHLDTLRGARATADLLVLGLNTDISISALKGPTRPIIPEHERAKLLAELECIDYVILYGTGAGDETDTPIPLLRELKPDILVKGGDYKHNEVVGWEVVEAYGGKVVTIPPVDGLSTTNIVEKIQKDLEN